jgi:hypothetical protein
MGDLTDAATTTSTNPGRIDSGFVPVSFFPQFPTEKWNPLFLKFL